MPWCWYLDVNALLWCWWLNADANALMLMPMFWYPYLGFDKLIPMPLWIDGDEADLWWTDTDALRPKEAMPQTLDCTIICEIIIRFDFFSFKVSSWKVSVPEKKKKVKLYLYSHHFLWFHITHYLTNTWQKNIHVCMFFFRGSLLCEWTQKSWTTPVKVYQWINDYFIQFLGYYRLDKK